MLSTVQNLTQVITQTMGQCVSQCVTEWLAQLLKLAKLAIELSGLQPHYSIAPNLI